MEGTQSVQSPSFRSSFPNSVLSSSRKSNLFIGRERVPQYYWVLIVPALTSLGKGRQTYGSPPMLKALDFEQAMKIFLVLLMIPFLSSCESTASWNDEYDASFHPEGHHNLVCTNEEATEIAAREIEKEYPKHYERFRKVGFDHWAPIYGEYKGKNIQRYTYKTVLAYKVLYSEPMRSGRKIESIEVSMSKDCSVLGVDYFKGRVDEVI